MRIPGAPSALKFRVFGNAKDFSSAAQPMLGRFAISDALTSNLTLALEAQVRAVVGEQAYVTALTKMCDLPIKVIREIDWGQRKQTS